MALTTGPANLQQVVERAVVLRGRVGNQGIPTTSRPRPGNHDVSSTRVFQAGRSDRDRVVPKSDGSILPLAHPRTSCPTSWGSLVGNVKRSSFQRKRFELFSPMAGQSDFSDSSNSLQQDVAARCLFLVDPRLDEMGDAPRRRARGPFANFSKEPLGMRTSSKLAPFSLSQLSLPTEEEVGACPDFSNGVPPWCLKYLETYTGALPVTPHFEPYTDPLLQRNCRQYLRLIKKLHRLHMSPWTLHPQERVGIFFVKLKSHRLRIGQSRDVSKNGREVSGQMIDHDEWMYPCADALPMGFSWSLYLAQSVNEHTLA